MVYMINFFISYRFITSFLPRILSYYSNKNTCSSYALYTFIQAHTATYKLIQLLPSTFVPLHPLNKLLALCMALQSLSMFNTLHYSLWFTVQRVYVLDTNASEWLRHIPLCTVVKVKLSNNQILRFKQGTNPNRVSNR